ncbi:MAG: hypothetical protein ACFE0S_09805 [Rhodospirillales bacterium]
MENDDKYLMRQGAHILSVANDLKRTPEALAEELGYPYPFMTAALAGKVTLDEMSGLTDRMYQTYPVSMAELWIDRDETDGGVRVMSESESRASSRVFERVDGHGNSSPYYEYRDTAMVKSSPYKPEWIKELKFVADNDPDNPDVVYNKGHLLHQQTFFIGEVNFYWKSGGKSHCREMNTGDSNYITPYVPHSFTSRNADRPGLIIAVTFANNISSARSALNYFGPDDLQGWIGDKRDAAEMFRLTVSRHRENEMVTERQLAARLAALGIRDPEALARGEPAAPPAQADIEALAQALNVFPEEFAVAGLTEAQEVSLAARSDADARPFPDSNAPSYILRDLARSPHMPGLKGFDVEVVQDHGEPSVFRHAMHEYIYNYGDVPVEILYGEGRRATIESDGSAYISPMVPHAFSATGGTGRLAVVRVAGSMTKETIQELASFAPQGRNRAKTEITLWY